MVEIIKSRRLFKSALKLLLTKEQWNKLKEKSGYICIDVDADKRKSAKALPLDTKDDDDDSDSSQSSSQ